MNINPIPVLIPVSIVAPILISVLFIIIPDFYISDKLWDNDCFKIFYTMTCLFICVLIILGMIHLTCYLYLRWFGGFKL